MASPPGVSRSQRTPLARSMMFRAPARWTMPGPDSGSRAAGSLTGAGRRTSAPNSRWSSELSSSVASEYRTPTEGTEIPRSICDMRLAEHPIRRASSRTDNCRSSRARRSRGPSPVSGSKPADMV
jgi:hypothetical protein